MDELTILRNFFLNMKRLAYSGAYPEDKETSLSEHVKQTELDLDELNNEKSGPGVEEEN